MYMMMMLVYMYKSQSQALTVKHLNFLTLENLCLKTPIFRSYSTKRTIPTKVESSEFTISSFLENKCGLSGKALTRVSKSFNFDSSDQRPHSVVELFRTFGFPQPDITRIIFTFPLIFKYYDPQKIIKPKLDFLLSISQSEADVIAIVTTNPLIVARSLNKHLIPFYNMLKSVMGCYPSALAVLKCNPFVLTHKAILLNIQFLITLDVPQSQILKLLRVHGQVLNKPHARFHTVVLKLKDMGFDLTSSYFCQALTTLTFTADSAWNSRCMLFRSFGFSHHETLLMFKKLPSIMCYNEKSFNGRMEFFLNKLHWTTSRLSSNPAVLGYSLEKRTIPRCSVLQVLVSKNITGEGYMLSTILAMTEKNFVKAFVSAHKDEVPEVMASYQGKLKFDEYTFKQKGQLKLKPS